MAYPKDYRYTKEHEWIRVEGEVGVVGVTEYAQQQLGDVVYIELPEVGETFQAMDVFGSIESVKTAADLYLPVAGEILEVNPEIIDHPELVNESPHDRGWMVKIRILQPQELDQLLTAEEYEAYIETLQ